MKKIANMPDDMKENLFGFMISEKESSKLLNKSAEKKLEIGKDSFENLKELSVYLKRTKSKFDDKSISDWVEKSLGLKELADELKGKNKDEFMVSLITSA
jgi:cobalamin biosynthesis protein CobT